MANPYGIPAGPGRWQRAIDHYRTFPLSANGQKLETRIRTALESVPEGRTPHGHMPAAFLRQEWLSGSAFREIVVYRTCSWFCAAMQLQIGRVYNAGALQTSIVNDYGVSHVHPPTREVRCQVCGAQFDAEAITSRPTVIFPQVPDLEEVPEDVDDMDDDVPTPKLDALLGRVSPWDEASDLEFGDTHVSHETFTETLLGVVAPPRYWQDVEIDVRTGVVLDRRPATRVITFTTELEHQLFMSLSPAQRLDALAQFWPAV